MPSQPSALFVYKVMALGQKVANETALNQPQAFIQLLSRLGNDPSRENNPFAILGVFQVLHQPEIIEMPFDSAPDSIGLSNIQCFKLATPTTPEHIDAWSAGELCKVRSVDKIFPTSIF